MYTNIQMCMTHTKYVLTHHICICMFVFVLLKKKKRIKTGPYFQ